MELSELVRMSREENPSRHLAKLSKNWVGKSSSKKYNPVANAITLRRWRVWLLMLRILTVLWLLIVVVYWPYFISTNHPKDVFFWTGSILAVACFSSFLAWFGDNDADSILNTNENARCFIRAITLLEHVMGKSIESWDSYEFLAAKGTAHLVDLASEIQVIERLVDQDRERVPWATSNREQLLRERRRKFDESLGLLSRLLSITGDKKVYFTK